MDRLASRISGPSADSILPHDFPGVAGNAATIGGTTFRAPAGFVLEPDIDRSQNG
jgi:hypothetical protein